MLDQGISCKQLALGAIAGSWRVACNLLSSGSTAPDAEYIKKAATDTNGEHVRLRHYKNVFGTL